MNTLVQQLINCMMQIILAINIYYTLVEQTYTYILYMHTSYMKMNMFFTINNQPELISWSKNKEFLLLFRHVNCNSIILIIQKRVVRIGTPSDSYTSLYSRFRNFKLLTFITSIFIKHVFLSIRS